MNSHIVGELYGLLTKLTLPPFNHIACSLYTGLTATQKGGILSPTQNPPIALIIIAIAITFSHTFYLETLSLLRKLLWMQFLNYFSASVIGSHAHYI